VSVPQPRLAVVGSETAPERASDLASPRRGRLGLPLLLGLLLTAALLALGLQTRRAGELSERAEVLSAQLSASRAALVTQRAHMGEVRASVSELRARIGALDALVQREEP